MPQLNGGGGDDLGANDEMISFKDEGEQEEKISENVSAERDLDDVKSSLVNESESSSDSEVRTLHTRTHARHARCSAWRETRFNAVESFNSFFPSVCLPPSYLPFTPSSPVSKQRGAPKPDPTQKVMRKRGTTSAKVNNNHHSTESQKENAPYLLHGISYVASLPSLIPTFLFIPAALRRQQDGGFFKSPHYPGYPFLMIPDLTNPYLSNGSLSPSARTVSVLVYSLDTLFLILSHSQEIKKTLAVRKSSLRTARPPYSPPTGLSRSSNYFFVL